MTTRITISENGGASESIIIDGGKPAFGTRQGVYFREFDPPRSRKFCVKALWPPTR
jgi:thiamine phosphate synthase YjbQ (UPF0047 family)